LNVSEPGKYSMAHPHEHHQRRPLVDYPGPLIGLYGIPVANVREIQQIVGRHVRHNLELGTFEMDVRPSADPQTSCMMIYVPDEQRGERVANLLRQTPRIQQLNINVGFKSLDGYGDKGVAE
jgi:hypothetical protein